MGIEASTPASQLIRSRADAALDRVQLARARSGLSQQEQQAVDEALGSAFLGLKGSAASTGPRLEQLARFVAAGAQPTGLLDHELTPLGNYASVLGHWLEGGDDETLQSLVMLLRAGDAFVTNRAYAGNGGMPAVYWVLERLGGGHSSAPPNPPSEAELANLLERFCAYAPETSRFWGDLFWGSIHDVFARIARADGPPTEEQQRLATWLTSLIMNPFSQTIFKDLEAGVGESYDEGLYGSGHALVQVLVEVLASPHTEFLYPLLFGPSRWQQRQIWSWFFSKKAALAFFRSSTSRKALKRLLGRSRPFRQGLVENSDLVFRLVESCERSTVEALLQREAPTLLQLRNTAGDSLLHVASRSRAPVHAMVKAMLSAGFDPAQLNINGESSVMLAEGNGRKKTLVILLTPGSTDRSS